MDKRRRLCYSNARNESRRSERIEQMLFQPTFPIMNSKLESLWKLYQGRGFVRSERSGIGRSRNSIGGSFR